MPREVTRKQAEAYHSAMLFWSETAAGLYLDANQIDAHLNGRFSQAEATQAKQSGNADRGEASRRLNELRTQSGEETSLFDAQVCEFVDRLAAEGAKALRPYIRSLRGLVVNWLNEQLDASPDLAFAVGSVHEAALLSLTESAAWLLHTMPSAQREAAKSATTNIR